MKDFGGFTDAVETYPLTKGKQSGNDDDDDDLGFKRFSGKFKVNVTSATLHAIVLYHILSYCIV